MGSTAVNIDSYEQALNFTIKKYLNKNWKNLLQLIPQRRSNFLFDCGVCAARVILLYFALYNKYNLLVYQLNVTNKKIIKKGYCTKERKNEKNWIKENWN
jgi:hypothetical protein